MINFSIKTEDHNNVVHSITLPFDIRQKSRFKSNLDSGGEVTIMLPRGSRLKHGDVLQADSGDRVKVVAALENVSMVSTEDQFLLMRICYHLGNRHVPLQIEKNAIYYQNDHVLDEMVNGLGIQPVLVTRAFEPEAGAYAHH